MKRKRPQKTLGRIACDAFYGVPHSNWNPYTGNEWERAARAVERAVKRRMKEKPCA